MFLCNFQNNCLSHPQKQMIPYLGKKSGGWKWSLGRRRGGREQTFTSLPALLALPFLWDCTYKSKSWEKSSVWVQPKASGGFKSILRPVGFLFLSGGFGELTLPPHDPLELPLCKKLHFSQRPPWNDFPHVFPDSNEKEKAKGPMKECS